MLRAPGKRAKRTGEHISEVLAIPNYSAVTVPANDNGSLLTFEDALKKPIAHKMPSTMRTVATMRAAGKTPGQIARELEIPRRIVEQYIAQMVQCLHCLPPVSIVEKAENRRTKGGPQSRGAAVAGTGQLAMVEANCHSCGCRIEKDEERTVLAVMHIFYGCKDEEDLGDYIPSLDIRKVFHFCGSCDSAEEFRVNNPWHLTPEERRWIEECEADARAESIAIEEQLSTAVANGDRHEFNKLMPRRPDEMTSWDAPFRFQKSLRGLRFAMSEVETTRTCVPMKSLMQSRQRAVLAPNPSMMMSTRER